MVGSVRLIAHNMDDTDRTGHTLMITPASVAKEGFRDAELDDFVEDGYFKRNQERQLRIIKDRWQVGWSETHTSEGATKSNGHS